MKLPNNNATSTRAAGAGNTILSAKAGEWNTDSHLPYISRVQLSDMADSGQFLTKSIPCSSSQPKIQTSESIT